jgi:transcriptional regulator with XRE-family HTH domain
MTSATKKSELFQRLRAARDRMQYTQAELAAKLGFSRASIAQWETPNPTVRVTPSLDQLKMLGEALDVPVPLLFSDEQTLEQFERAIAGAGDPIEVVHAVRDPLTQAELMRRRAQAFWDSVRSQVVLDQPELADAFDVPCPRAGFELRASALIGAHLFRFAELTPAADPDPASVNEFLAREVGHLLACEYALNSTSGVRRRRRVFRKHLVVWTNSGKLAGFNKVDLHASMGVELFATNDVPRVVAHILSCANAAVSNDVPEIDTEN